MTDEIPADGESTPFLIDDPILLAASRKERREPTQWVPHHNNAAEKLRLLYDDLYALDCQIEALRPQLLEAQPFGARRLDLRWWSMGVGRSDRIDPIPVYYIQAAAHAPRKWNVVRLDRGSDSSVRLQDKLRVVGGFTNEKPRYKAYRIATKLQAMLDDRRERVNRLTEIGVFIGKSAQPARRRAVTFALNKPAEMPHSFKPTQEF